MTQAIRVLVAGARFGEVYLNAFLEGIVAARPLVLAGLLAHGSQRARHLAHAHGVPLYTDVAQLPRDLDLACVVVRGGAMGGDGTVLAQTLLERGLHVIQEHPLHPGEVQRLQDAATRAGRLYWVNTLYPHTAAGRAWINLARRVRHAVGGVPPCVAQATMSRQLLYSGLDLLTQAADVMPDAVAVTLAADGGERTDAAFRALWLRTPDTDVLLQLQHYLDPADPDMHSVAMHRLCLGWPSGYLSLESTHGPVSWTPALALAGHRQAQGGWFGHGDADPGLSLPVSATLHRPPPTWLSAMAHEAPQGVARLLRLAAAAIDGAEVPDSLHPARQLALARLWQQVQRAAGPVREVSLPAPPRVDPCVLRTPAERDAP